MRILFLDDDYDRHLKFDLNNKKPGNEIHHIFQAHECIKRLGSYEFDVAHLDHDLGYGYDHYNQLVVQDVKIVVNHIVDNHIKIPKIIIHSWNEHGAYWMQSRLVGAGYNVTVEPFNFADFYNNGTIYIRQEKQ